MVTTTTHDPTSTILSSATASCTTAVPDKYGRVPVDACNSNYLFDPDFAANLAFAVFFGTTTLVHIIQAAIFKKRFCWVVIMGGIWETVAFSMKSLGARNQQNFHYALWGQLLFLLAPLWLNAFVYMAVARMVYFRMPDRKLLGIKAIRMTLIFVWIDVILFIVQGGGGSMLSNDEDMNLVRIGQKIYMAGVALQLVIIVVFSGLTAFFYYKLREIEGRDIGRMKWLIWTMLLVLMMIIIRIVYRLVEFGPGVNEHNKLLAHEGYPLGLDAFPILFALILLNVMHPGFVLRGPDSEFPSLNRQEKKALKQQKKRDKKALKQGDYELESGFAEDDRSGSGRGLL
ncbi:hypothetical protein FZEAL_1968 [Fusarium zealandicum]|uniref:Uncharacterized protein n=1 Tax=Fusarium zealandicum TaxID=1053134 RepID=A0A8H4XN90_9HYPO|nr:hypothetical protein FZEAL_1968 [Fusarium zealandicum]